MVTFCMRCGISLPPFATVVIREGKEMPSPHYQCPSCGKPAGTEENGDKNAETNNEPTEMVIKDGKITPK